MADVSSSAEMCSVPSPVISSIESQQSPNYVTVLGDKPTKPKTPDIQIFLTRFAEFMVLD